MRTQIMILPICTLQLVTLRGEEKLFVVEYVVVMETMQYSCVPSFISMRYRQQMEVILDNNCSYCSNYIWSSWKCLPPKKLTQSTLPPLTPSHNPDIVSQVILLSNQHSQWHTRQQYRDLWWGWEVSVCSNLFINQASCIPSISCLPFFLYDTYVPLF